MRLTTKKIFKALGALRGEEFPIDLKELYDAMFPSLKMWGWKIKLQEHPAYAVEKGAKKLIGYYPAGEWQIVAIPPRCKNGFSVIRGMVSWGLYEVFGRDMKDPERFEKPREVIAFLKGYKMKAYKPRDYSLTMKKIKKLYKQALT